MSMKLQKNKTKTNKQMTETNSQLGCIICYEPCDIVGIYDCNHYICGRCATKMTYLYKDLKCSQCNRISTEVTIAEKSDINITHTGELSSKGDASLKEGETAESSVANLNCHTIPSDLDIPEDLKNDLVKYKSKKAVDYVNELLTIKCKECFTTRHHSATFKTVNDLFRHYTIHKGIYTCKTCLDRNFELWDEIETFKTHQEFKAHKKNHIYCRFCDKMFFDTNHIRDHATKEHQLCTVCTVLGRTHRYYENYTALTDHYKAEHFCCSEIICQNNHCFVYAHKSEMWAHYHHVHKIQKDYEEIRINNLPALPCLNLEISQSIPRNKKVTKSLFENLSAEVRIVNPVVDSTAEFPTFTATIKKQDDIVKNIVKNTVGMHLQKEHKPLEKEIHTLINKNITKTYNDTRLSGEADLSQMSKDLEEIAQSYLTHLDKTEQRKVVYSLLSNLFPSEKRMKVFLVDYLNDIKYPRFEKKETKKEEPVVRKNQFKVVDLSKFRR